MKIAKDIELSVLNLEDIEDELSDDFIKEELIRNDIEPTEENVKKALELAFANSYSGPPLFEAPKEPSLLHKQANPEKDLACDQNKSK